MTKKTRHQKHLKQKQKQTRGRKRERPERWPQRQPFAQLGDDVLEDALPFFGVASYTSPDSPDAADLVMSLLANTELANEPELQAVLFEPMQSAETVIAVATERGLHNESLMKMPVEEREDIRFEVYEESIRRLLTDNLRRDIMAGLNSLRLRLKRSGKQADASRVAALQLFLGTDEAQAMWPMTGVIQAIFARSAAAGFKMAEAAKTLRDEGVFADRGLSLLDRVMRSRAVRKADELLNKIPGLNVFLRKQADKIWEKGLEAIYEGDLYLGLYSEQEMRGALQIFAEVFHIENAEQFVEQLPVPVTEEMAEVFMSRLDEYITRLFTPERLAQLQSRLDDILNEMEAGDEWMPFVVMLREYMQAPDAPEYEKRFLLLALLGEFRAATQTA